MDPKLNEQERELRERARTAAAELVAPVAAAADADVAAPPEVVNRLGSAGILEDGGDLTSLALVAEEIGRESASIGTIVVGHLTCMSLLSTAGDALALRSAGLGAGESVAALALDGGASILSDPQAVDGRRLESGGVALDGVAAGVAGATSADLLVVPARLSEEYSTIRCVVVEAAADGISIDDEVAKLGLNGSGMATVRFEGLEVGPAEVFDAVETSGGGYSGSRDEILDGILDRLRIGHAAVCVGVAQAALEASTRRVVDAAAPLSKSQSVQWMLADMATETDAARLLTWFAASRTDAGALTEAAAMARLVASDAAVRATRSAMQIFGQAGDTRGAGIERLYRDAKALEIHHGGREAQQRAIARRLLPDLVDVDGRD